MLIVRSLRQDRVSLCVTTFVINNLGSQFVEPPILDMKAVSDTHTHTHTHTHTQRCLLTLNLSMKMNQRAKKLTFFVLYIIVALGWDVKIAKFCVTLRWNVLRLSMTPFYKKLTFSAFELRKLNVRLLFNSYLSGSLKHNNQHNLPTPGLLFFCRPTSPSRQRVRDCMK